MLQIYSTKNSEVAIATRCLLRTKNAHGGVEGYQWFEVMKLMRVGKQWN